jgi:hypothetical protein
MKAPYERVVEMVSLENSEPAGSQALFYPDGIASVIIS